MSIEEIKITHVCFKPTPSCEWDFVYQLHSIERFNYEHTQSFLIFQMLKNNCSPNDVSFLWLSFAPYNIWNLFKVHDSFGWQDSLKIQQLTTMFPNTFYPLACKEKMCNYKKRHSSPIASLPQFLIFKLSTVGILLRHNLQIIILILDETWSFHTSTITSSSIVPLTFSCKALYVEATENNPEPSPHHYHTFLSFFCKCIPFNSSKKHLTFGFSHSNHLLYHLKSHTQFPSTHLPILHTHALFSWEFWKNSRKRHGQVLISSPTIQSKQPPPQSFTQLNSQSNLHYSNPHKPS